mmetsp:Transcript_4882/g.10341  ORF Transcript_4882/g.10341 Transcript_4882/m.10341 type:complete len:102 (-) Transcript_4882:765-1070(-)
MMLKVLDALKKLDICVDGRLPYALRSELHSDLTPLLGPLLAPWVSGLTEGGGKRRRMQLPSMALQPQHSRGSAAIVHDLPFTSLPRFRNNVTANSCNTWGA